MADTSWMARFGARLVTNGYPILPIGPGTKKPGRFQRGGWADYPEWNRHAERPTTEVEVATWATWPDCGIGIVGGAVAAVDIDIATDAELALQIEALARARLGDTPALRIGRAPKRMLVYRTAAPFRGIKRHPLEVLCLGQQFLAYADHPDTGAPYVWPDEGLADLDISDLPKSPRKRRRPFSTRPMRSCPSPCVSAVCARQHRPHCCAATGRSAPCPPSGRRSTGCQMTSSITTAGCASAWR